MTIFDPADKVPLRVETRNAAQALVTTGSVVFTVTAPNGTAGSGVAATETSTGLWDVDIDLTTSPYLGQPGQYVWRAVATGAVAGEFGGWFIVRARRTAGPVWTPELDAVADWIPARTLSSIATPGLEEYLGTFTSTTTPTDEQASRQIVNAVGHVQSRVGVTVDPALYDQARAATACLAAAYVELSYPTRDADLNTYDRLLAQANVMLDELVDANVAATGNPGSLGQTLLPQWSYPDPVSWGDQIIT